MANLTDKFAQKNRALTKQALQWRQSTDIS